MKFFNILSKMFTTYNGLAGLSIIVALGIYTLTLIGGDFHFIEDSVNWLNNLAELNANSGIGNSAILALASFLESLGHFLQGMGSSEWKNYFIPWFGEESIFGITLYSENNSMKINALGTFAPVFFITFATIFKWIPSRLFGRVSKTKTTTKKAKPVLGIFAKSMTAITAIANITVGKGSIYVFHYSLEAIYFIGEKTGLDQLSTRLMNQIRGVKYAI